MKICTLNNSRSALVLSICLMGACVTIAPQLQANEVQVGRYSMLSATPTEAQADLLATTIKVQLPKRIHTIGEAIRYLLQRSGFRLADFEAMSSETKGLFDLPLPAVHRNLGPISLRLALETLAGSAFQLIQDPVHRLIAFELCAPDRRVAQDASHNTLMEVPQHGE
jgi:conjugative transfer region protein (TIGR03748 family)